MTIVANVRTNWSAPFPSKVKANGPCTISKSNGIWTIGFQISNLAVLPAGTNPANVEVLLYNTSSQTFQHTTVATLLALSIVSPTSISAANSPYSPLVTDSILQVDTSGGPVEIDLTLAATRNGAPLSIKDINGNAASNNITIKPSGSETIDGHTNAAPLKINANYGGFRLNPKTAGYYIAP